MGAEHQPAFDERAQAERKARHEAWMRVSTPGEAHRVLEPLVGTWRAKVKAWFMPGQPPAESEGRMVTDWAAGGRFLRHDYRSEGPMGVFAGAGLFGHDNQAGRYVGVWVDVMSTAMMRHEGTFDASTRTLNMHGSMTDPVGQAWKVRQAIRIVSNDEHVFEIFMQGPTGPEYQSLRAEYTRVK